MSLDFASRIIGLIIFTLLGARLGLDLAVASGLDDQIMLFSAAFAMVGMLTGLILTPWLTVRPVRWLREVISERPIEMLFMALTGLALGLGLGLLLSYPLSLLGPPLGSILPTFLSLTLGYLGLSIGSHRAREIWTFIAEHFNTGRARFTTGAERKLLLDTSVLIDGRIVDVARTGFLGGTLLIPKFVLNELHQVADSSDMLRRTRGRRGLAKLNELRGDPSIATRIIEDDIEGVQEVDSKLIQLAMTLDAAIVTNDYNLNRVAEAQNIPVLNINALSNAVRTVYIPGESFPIHIIQEGRDPDQGVGYLEDGTMVVIANGKSYMDRTINVTVTRLINKETGRMIFAEPEQVHRPIGS